MAAGGVAGLSATPAFLPSAVNGLKRAVEMRARFGMDGDAVGAGLGEGFEIADRRARSSDARRRASS